MDIQSIAETRRKNVASTRILSEDYEEIGVIGEKYFSFLISIPLDTKQYIDGDKSVDFLIPITIDVKSARKPFNLIVEKDHVKSTIYVLMGINDDNTAYPVGWEWGFNLIKIYPKDFGYGVLNHYIPASNLKSIERLIEFIKKITWKDESLTQKEIDEIANKI